MDFNKKLQAGYQQLGVISKSVMFSHTLFSLPFVLAAILLQSFGHPDVYKLLLIVLAATGARNAANALNRLVDHQIDAANPRTADRPLPQGKINRPQLWWLTVGMLILFILSTALLNLLCLILLPVALFFIFLYSYTKRFTWLCHYILGFTCSMATMGGFLALSGHFELRYFILMGAVALWVAGFDIIYARQDIEFDRKYKLHSLPGRFGAKIAIRAAQISHLFTFLGFCLLPLFWPLGFFYFIGLFLVALLLIMEQILANGKKERHIQWASYNINQIVAVVFLLIIMADIYLSPLFFPGAWSVHSQGFLGRIGPGLEWNKLFVTDIFSPEFWKTLISLFNHTLAGLKL